MLRKRGMDWAVSMLTCPLCGHEMDARQPGVASHRADYDPAARAVRGLGIDLGSIH